ncbi:MAG TPA: hypothetical protein VNK94_04700 [Gaiellaceae bacterium]|nr:hypothetical protein [Gaiellaceae bacterium]
MSIWREVWLEELRQRLDSLIDDAQRRKDGGTITSAGALVERLTEIEKLAGEIDRELSHLEDGLVLSDNARPPSFLLLPAGGEASARHFRDTVQTGVDPASLDEWLPDQADEVRARIKGQLAAWGLRDDSRLMGGRGGAPIIWDRIFVGTLALFSDGPDYVCSARVIGKGLSDTATRELWYSPEFRWLLLLSDLRWFSVPVEEIVAGAGFDPAYRVNRQALVPKPHREEGIWRAIRPHLQAR